VEFGTVLTSGKVFTYLLVIVSEYSRQGKASKPLASQMTRRASLARRLDIRCCSGRTIAIYLQRQETL